MKNATIETYDIGVENIEKLAGPFGMPGGKHWQKKAIVAVLPEHTRYVEPFAGAASVLLEKKPAAEEVLSDKDPGIAFFWRYVKRYGGDRVSKLRQRFDWSISETGHEKFKRVLNSNPKDDDERFYKLLWLQTASWRGDRATFQPSRANASFSVLNRLDAYRERLKNVTVLHGDFSDVCRKYDGPNTLFFLDPPYEEKENAGTKATAHGKWFGKIGADVLKSTVNGMQGRFILTLPLTEFWRSFEFGRDVRVRKVKVHKMGQRTGLSESRYELWFSNFELSEVPTMVKVVPGSGPETAALAVIGDAPGRMELSEGKPLVGLSGELVRTIMEKADFNPEHVFWDNVFQSAVAKLDGEAIEDNRAAFESRMTKIHNDAYIALGAVAARGLVPGLGQDVKIGKIVGKRLWAFDGKPVFVTLHPSFALRKGPLQDTGEFTKIVSEATKAAFEKQREPEGLHPHPHEPNGKHDHPGLPPATGGHFHGDPPADGVEPEVQGGGAHRHRVGDPLEGNHSPFGDGRHVHPAAQGIELQVPVEETMKLHLERPWLKGFKLAHIRERATVDSPWQDWRAWNASDNQFHAVFPMHVPECDVSAHVEMFLDPNTKLIDKLYEFEDGTRRAPTTADFVAECQFFSERRKALSTAVPGAGAELVPPPAMPGQRKPEDTEKIEKQERGKFVLQRRSWRVREAVQEATTRVFWHVRLDFGGETHEQFLLETSPVLGRASGAYSSEQSPDLWDQEGEVEPKDIGPPKPEEGPVMIQRVDEGEVTRIEERPKSHRYEFLGKKLKGLFSARDQGDGVWSFFPGKTPVAAIGKCAFAKFEKKKQIVYTVVYRPREIDLQREWIGKADVEEMAHQWAEDFALGKVEYDFMHEDGKPYGRDLVFPVENFIHRGPSMKWGRETLLDGDWAQGIKIKDADLWNQIESGEIRGVSIAGAARGTNQTPSQSSD